MKRTAPSLKTNTNPSATAVVGPWPLGMTEQHRAYDLKTNDLISAINLDITDHGQAVTRPGYTKVCNLTDGHSLFAWQNEFVVVDNGILVFGKDKQTILTLKNKSKPLSYSILNSKLYCSNSKEGYVIDPDFSYIEWDKDFEDLEEIEQITPNYDPRPNADSPIDFKGDITTQPRVLSPIRLVPLPYGYPIVAAFGRLWSAADNIIYFSQSLNYLRMDDQNNYFMFPETVTMMVALDDGIYIGTKSMVYWINGTTPNEFSLVEVQTGGCLGGIMLSNQSEKLPGNVAYWQHDTQGPTFGLNKGKIETPLQGRISRHQSIDGIVFNQQQNANGVGVVGAIVKDSTKNTGLRFGSKMTIS